MQLTTTSGRTSAKARTTDIQVFGGHLLDGTLGFEDPHLRHVAEPTSDGAVSIEPRAGLLPDLVSEHTGATPNQDPDGATSPPRDAPIRVSESALETRNMRVSNRYLLVQPANGLVTFRHLLMEPALGLQMPLYLLAQHTLHVGGRGGKHGSAPFVPQHVSTLCLRTSTLQDHSGRVKRAYQRLHGAHFAGEIVAGEKLEHHIDVLARRGDSGLRDGRAGDVVPPRSEVLWDPAERAQQPELAR
ncbi:MAG: hypothetical protein U0821_26045 [Chloroflexota bacterium]